MPAYYNENDAHAAAWLRELMARGLIAPGHIDERSIADVRPGDLAGYRQCHFFAGIGVWSYALRLAGWPDDREVWTGSCPCQTHSSAARGRHTEPDWWPIWRPLIAARRPRAVFGEQVAQARDWLDGLCDDMEAMDYEVGAAVLPACSVGTDHARHRIYFAGDTDRHGESSGPVDAKVAWLSRRRGNTRSVLPAHGASSRVRRLHAYGNAIHAELAAEFIRSYREARFAQ
jgi:DNA (cytosine-5)-methyltransferase 1